MFFSVQVIITYYCPLFIQNVSLVSCLSLIWRISALIGGVLVLTSQSNGDALQEQEFQHGKLLRRRPSLYRYFRYPHSHQWLLSPYAYLFDTGLIQPQKTMRSPVLQITLHPPLASGVTSVLMRDSYPELTAVRMILVHLIVPVRICGETNSTVSALAMLFLPWLQVRQVTESHSYHKLILIYMIMIVHSGCERDSFENICTMFSGTMSTSEYPYLLHQLIIDSHYQTRLSHQIASEQVLCVITHTPDSPQFVITVS